MLQLLNIENIAVIEKAEIEFGTGFNVLTGETGAGKSIVIDSLETALGWRTSREIVRRGAKNARVTAVFSSEGTDAWCSDNGIELENDSLILQRTIGEDGKSSCRINGVPVPAAQVRELGLLLIDIHGQGEGQRLTNEKYHGAYLDSFGGYNELIEKYRSAWREFKEIRSELEDLKMDEGEKSRRIDMLTYQINELERVSLTPGEYDEKTARRDFLKSAGKLTGIINEASSAICGWERGDGAMSLISAAEDAVSRGTKYSSDLGELEEKLKNLRYAAEDVSYDLRELTDRLDFSPQELDELEERLDTLRRVLKKYGGTEESAAEYLENAKQELDNIQFSEEKTSKLEAKLEKALEKANKIADELSEKRRETAKVLSAAVEKELSELSMIGARFAVDLGDGEALGPDGKDDIRFTMCANAGEAMGRISKVASGGELSRIMLAMKSVLTRTDDIGAMVFDEIDTGVSGIAAQRVAEKLSAISSGKQVICVTHLPQIAAMADVHFEIQKSEFEGRVYTNINSLDDEGRARELARLISGDSITPTTMQTAKELLDNAKRFKD